ncbi:MAG: SUMF1/EgtB/PvdO family nonheme iron enzyme [Chloroflexi bacterium]|nr:SUMF1/EgtB/PvdO family nonheme iron enzyme [Chloroflexota bacterium]
MTKIGRRRNRNEGVQWLVIGVILGMACSFTVGFAGYVFGLIDFKASSTDGEREIQVVTSTPNPSLPDLTPTTPAIIDVPTTQGQTNETPVTPSQVIATFTPTDLPGAASVTPDGGGSGGPETTPNIGTPLATTFLPSAPSQDNSAALAIGATSLVAIQGGSFRMGTTLEEGQAAVAECVQRYAGGCTDDMITDAIPPHDVTLDNFQIEQYEVSVIQYVNYLNYLIQLNPSNPRPHLSACNGPCALTFQDTGGEASDISYNNSTQRYEVRVAGVDRSTYPITLVTWNGAYAYCQALGRFLPTEAQWERAARGLSNSIYPWGPVWDENRAKTNRPVQDGTVPVDAYSSGASLGASDFGVYNMAGNVAEWTADWYQANYYQQLANSGQTTINPTGPVSGQIRVVRGGSWSNPPLFARTVHRVDRWEPGQTSTWVGFRCAANAGVSSAPPVSNPNTNGTTNTVATTPAPVVQPTTGGSGIKPGSSSSNTTPASNPPTGNIPSTATLAADQ